MSLIEPFSGCLKRHHCVLAGSRHGCGYKFLNVVVLCKLGAVNGLVGTSSGGVTSCGSGEYVSAMCELNLVLVLQLKVKLQELRQKVVESLINSEDGLCCGVSSMMACNENSRTIRLERFEEVKATGADDDPNNSKISKKEISHFVSIARESQIDEAAI